MFNQYSQSCFSFPFFTLLDVLEMHLRLSHGTNKHILNHMNFLVSSDYRIIFSYERKWSVGREMFHTSNRTGHMSRHRKYSSALQSTKDTLTSSPQLNQRLHATLFLSVTLTHTLAWKLKLTQTPTYRYFLGLFHRLCPCTGLQRGSLHHTVAKLTIKHTCKEIQIATGLQRKALFWQRPYRSKCGKK